MATQWPPRSPHEALLSTPGGREKLRRVAERSSPSPSPSRHRTSQPTTGKPLGAVYDDGLFEGGDDDDDDDDDEETLQLKLQAIQARLKLKKLQAAKAQKKAAAAAPNSRPGHSGGMREVPLQSKLAAARDRMERQATQNAVQVPASPVKRSQTTSDLQTSPQRVLLGIDKGLKAADMSLKRAPSQRRANEPRQGQQALGGQIQQQVPRPLSFNERLASARTEEVARQERRERAQRQRSTAFSVGRQEMEDYKNKALELPDLPSRPHEFSRDQILSSIGQTGRNTRPTTRLGHSADPPTTATSTGDGDSGPGFDEYSGLHLSKRILPRTVLARAVSEKKPYVLQDLLRLVKAPDWSLPDDESDFVVFAIVASKSDPRSHRPGGDGKPQPNRGKYMVLTLVDLTYEVELFLFNSGFDRFWKLTPGTVLAILNPGILPPPPGREATNRFGLVINSDEDTILEVGNARDLGYCKSIKKDGTYCKSWVNARRTEYCEFHTNEAVRKARSARIEMSSTAGFGGGGGDGPRGRSNSRRLFHKADEERKHGHYDRATQSQYFISTAHRATDPDDERVTGIADRKEREEALKRRLAQREKERDIARRLGELGAGAGREYMSRAATAGTATTTRGPTHASSFSSATSSTSATTTTTNPTLSASSLNTSLSNPSTLPSTTATTSGIGGERKWDAQALGLVGRRAADQPKIDLGPAAKRKWRPGSPASSSTTTTTTGAGGNNTSSRAAPLGWGSSLKDKLARMKEGERLDGGGGRAAAADEDAETGGGEVSHGGGGGAAAAASARGDKSPVRKKTRFVTERGIREAGRDSLGEPLSAAVKLRRQAVVLDDDDDDDDDLIVVK